MRQLLVACLTAASAYGADLYAVVNASRDASTDALLASYVAAVDRDLAPAAAEAEALALQASLAADAHDAALKEARQAAAHARTARAAVEDALLDAKRAIRHAASALKQAVQGKGRGRPVTREQREWWR